MLPDREARFLRGPGTAWPDAVREVTEAYGYEAARARRFQPTQTDVGRYLDVLAWLTWLNRRGHEGRRGVNLIVARAFGSPLWKLASRFGRSDDTIRRWEAKAIASITVQFADEVAALAAAAPDLEE